MRKGTMGVLALSAMLALTSSATAGLADSATSSPAAQYGDASLPSPPSITDSIVVGGSSITSISTIEVILSIDHAWLGDHQPVTLTKIGGPSIVLFSKPGSPDGTGFGDSSDLCGTNPITFNDAAVDASETMGFLEFSDECVGDFGPSTFLASGEDGTVVSLDATFAGVDFNGTWELSIVDSFPDYTGGTLNSWTINVTGVPEPTTIALLGLGGLVLIRRRR